VAEALGKIGDASAKAPLLEALTKERYVTSRAPEARALLALGAKAELRAPLARFAGVPEPMLDAIVIAREAGILEPKSGGWAGEARDVSVKLAAPKGPARLLVLASSRSIVGTVDGRPLPPSKATGAVHVFEIGELTGQDVVVTLKDGGGLKGVWLVARAEEIEPPPPEPW
jgi:hypothetical protein